MLNWLSALRDDSPLANAQAAKKFVAGLDKDLFAAAQKLASLLQEFRQNTQQRDIRHFEALLALDEAARPIRTRLEQDFLAAAGTRHSLRDRLWESGYDLAQRFAEAYRLAFAEQGPARLPKARDVFAQAAVRLLAQRTSAYRYRLYRHEEWVASAWREINASFRAICDCGLDAVAVATAHGSTRAHTFFCILHLLRLANAGSFTPQQTFMLWQKLTEFAADARLTPRPTCDHGFVIDVAGDGGLQPRQHMPQGGQFLFLDTTAIYSRACAWIDELERQANVRPSQPGPGSLPVKDLLSLRSAVLRIDPEFKPLTRASQRSKDGGRLLACRGIQSASVSVNHDPRLIIATLDGSADLLSGSELITMGYFRPTNYRRGRLDLPPELANVDLRYWHMRDRSDTGFRAVVSHAGDLSIRLRDLALLSEDPPHAGWQIAIVVRLLKLPAGHLELGLQVISRDAEMVELASIRVSNDQYVDGSPTLSQGLRFKALRLRSAFYGKPVMGSTWILPAAEYSPGIQYVDFVTHRRYILQQQLAEGSDWIWVKPTEVA